MADLLVVALVSNAVLAYICLMLIVPSCARSRFRYELWALRDELTDEVYKGHFKNTDQPRRLVREIEVVIQGAAEVTVFKMWLLTRLARNANLPRAQLVDLNALGKGDRERLAPRVERFYWLISKQAVFGSASGWFFLIVLAWILLADLLGASRSLPKAILSLREQAKEHVREEIPVEPALTVLTQRVNGRAHGKQPVWANV
jgi:hypothetical protein